MMRGSIDEDAGTRPLHHFFDPVYSRGLTMVGVEFLAAKPWSQDTLAQAGVVDNVLAGITKPLFSSRDDYSWGRAIYEYAWGDKQRGLETLGHILHLIEDMSVPDHTRNDSHPPFGDSFLHQVSPYEHWADKWNTSTIAVADVLIGENKILESCVTLNSCFDSIARYSNNNFFSKDTILKNYDLPKVIERKTFVLSDGIPYLFGSGKTTDNRDVILSLIKRKINPQTGQEYETYFLNDPDDIVLFSYLALMNLYITPFSIISKLST